MINQIFSQHYFTLFSYLFNNISLIFATLPLPVHYHPVNKNSRMLPMVTKSLLTVTYRYS
jgi:hypothetical protein